MATKTTEPVATPEGRFLFLSVFRARKNKQKNDKLEFSATIGIEKSVDLKDLKRIAGEAAYAKWGAAAGNMTLNSPFVDGDTAREKNGKLKKEKYPEMAGKIVITAKTDFAVPIFNGNNEEIIDEGQLFSGCFGQMSVVALAYDTSGNQGVTFGLRAVRRTRAANPKERLGNGGKVDAESAFGGAIGGDAPEDYGSTSGAIFGDTAKPGEGAAPKASGSLF